MTKQKPNHAANPGAVAERHTQLTGTPESCDAERMIHQPDRENPPDDDSCAPRERPNFPLGRLVATPGALEALSQDDICRALQRHLSGDWGEVDAEDRAANDQALVEGTRLLSSYKAANGTKFWVITEADRSATTVLLPSEY